jgi:uncharacterized membrane protein
VSRKLKLFFTISVLLNILLIGTMAGFVAKCHYRPGPNLHDMAKLSPAGKAMMAESFNTAHDQMGDTFAKARAARADIVAILEADTFDKKAFDAASEKLRKLQMKIMQRRTATAADLSAKLDPADRKLLAEWLAGPGGHSPSKYFPYKKGGKDMGKTAPSSGDGDSDTPKN